MCKALSLNESTVENCKCPGSSLKILHSLDTSLYSILFMSVKFAKVYINIMKALISFYLFILWLNKQHVPDNMQNNQKLWLIY